MSQPDIDERLRLAGLGLGLNGISWGKRPRTSPALTITRRDRQLLATVYDLGYLTTSMLALLFWGRPSSAAYARIRLLHDAGLLDRLRPRVARNAGSHEWIHRLTDRGWNAIVRHDVPDAPKHKAAKLTSISYVEHDLQVNALVLHVAVAAARARGWRYERGLASAVPFIWLGPQRGRIGAEGGGVRTPVLVPDATLLGVDASGRSTAVLIEYDRTARAHKQISKWRRYDDFLAVGWRTSCYADLDIEPLVLFISDDKRRLPSFLASADEHLIATAPNGDGEAEYPGREQVAFSSREFVMRDDWRLLQISHRPTARHPAGRQSRTTRLVDLELPRLFVTPIADHCTNDWRGSRSEVETRPMVLGHTSVSAGAP